MKKNVTVAYKLVCATSLLSFLAISLFDVQYKQVFAKSNIGSESPNITNSYKLGNILNTHNPIDKLIEGAVANNVVSYTFDSNVDLSTIKGFVFDFAPTASTSYNIEITDSDANVWSTNGTTGLSGNKGSCVLFSKAANASAFYTNGFDSVAAGSYKVYVPFEFYTGLTQEENVAINPVFKIKGFDDGLGVAIGSTKYELPTELNSTINFISSDNAGATALKNAISNIELVTDDSQYVKTQLNVKQDVLNSAISGYNELGTRKTVEFKTDSTMVKWTAGTGMSAAAGFMLKMGNTGANDVKIRVEISENGTNGRDSLTESYNNSATNDNEYYRFIHGNNSIKAIGTEEKLLISKRQFILPAGYQGLILVPFIRLRYQTAGYLAEVTNSYINGRFDTTLGAIRLYVNSTNTKDFSTNSLTFYALNAIKAADGAGVSFKQAGASSGGSSVAANNTDQATVLSTAPNGITTVNSTKDKSETITVSTPNSGDNASKLYIGQTGTITVTNLLENVTYTPKLTYGNTDISDELIESSNNGTAIVYKYRSILQSRGTVTFDLSYVCNEEYHTYDKGVITTDATCETSGVKTYTCSTCGHIKEETINATNHNYGSWEITTEPTTTQEGEAKRVCSNDQNHIDTFTLPVLTNETVWSKTTTSSTCKVKGKDSYTSVYGTVEVELPLAGHTFEWVTDQAATKLATGLKHEECSVCHEHRNDNTVIPVEICNHKNVTPTEGVAETCEASGSKAYYYCEDCHKYFSDVECQNQITDDINTWKVISATNHNYGSWEITTEPTTTQEGEAKRVCSNDQNHIDTFTLPVLTNETVWSKTTTPSTCKVKGKDTYTSDYGTVEVELPLAGHTFEWVTDQAATKLATGLKHEECSVCHEHRNDNTVIAIETCNHENVTKTDAVTETCTTAGNKEYYYCEDCHKYFQDAACTDQISDINTWKVISAKNHNYGEVSYTWSTDNSSLTAVKVCANDNSHRVVVNATINYEVISQATCTTTGTGRYTATFNEEGYETQTKDVIIEKAAHKYNKIDEIPATYSTAGVKEHYTCEDCEELFVKVEDNYVATNAEDLVIKILSKTKVVLVADANQEFTADGTGKSPVFTIKDINGVAINNVNVSVRYEKDGSIIETPIEAGTYIMFVELLNEAYEFEGSTSVTFKINSGSSHDKHEDSSEKSSSTSESSQPESENPQPSKPGCGGSATASAFGLLVLGCSLLGLKKKNK